MDKSISEPIPLLISTPMPRPSPADTLFGDKSLNERFGNLEGRELLDKVFDFYQVGWGMGNHRVKNENRGGRGHGQTQQSQIVFSR